MKGMVVPGTLFEELGFNYIGPVDGHDVDTLVKTLRNMRALKGPQFLHVVTRKGKGYEPAEKDPIKWHGPAAFDASTGISMRNRPRVRLIQKYSVHGYATWQRKEPRLVAITPAMREGSGLVEFAEAISGTVFRRGYR